MFKFWKHLEHATERTFATYADLHRYSVEHYQEFWRLYLRYSGVVYEGNSRPVCEGSDLASTHFFHKLKLNFAENLLRHRDSRCALVAVSESGPRRQLNYRDLHQEVARIQAGLIAAGVTQGDRVAGIMPNSLEAVIAMLATTALGAVWTSCSPEFGVQGILDRFGQVEPKVLFAPNAYVYAGKQHDCLEKAATVANALKSLTHVVCIPFVEGAPTTIATSVPQSVWTAFGNREHELRFQRVGFNDPLYIMYSSGTTGAPKCIVHGVGGTLLQHVKELTLHCDLSRDANITYYTTCGWMMWNWLVSALYTGCTVTLYDGSPSHPDLSRLWRLCEDEGITHFGTSARYIASCRSEGLEPKKIAHLDKMVTLLSTGSPLLPEDFDWIYSHVESDVQVASICGGTDILSCFMLGNPMLPVYRGEIQALGLGMDVAALGENKQPVTGQKGELVCRTPFPSMPVTFWGHEGDSKYRQAYFERVPGVWHHGDYIEMTQTQGSAGGIIVYGRSDATLNPGGVRIGTAEIYRLVEALPEVADSIVVGEPVDGDVRIVLFVKLQPGHSLNDNLIKAIQATLRSGASPRHVPKLILAVDKIPYTLSGKKTELAVLDMLAGREPKNREALQDPGALEIYRNATRGL